MWAGRFVSLWRYRLCKAIGVPVRAVLPSALWNAGRHLDVDSQGKALVIGHPAAPITGERLARSRRWLAQLPDQGMYHSLVILAAVPPRHP